MFSSLWRKRQSIYTLSQIAQTGRMECSGQRSGGQCYDCADTHSYGNTVGKLTWFTNCIFFVNDSSDESTIRTWGSLHFPFSFHHVHTSMTPADLWGLHRILEMRFLSYNLVKRGRVVMFYTQFNILGWKAAVLQMQPELSASTCFVSAGQ